MSRTILSRTSAALVTLLVSSVVVFLLIQAVPGDIVAQMLGQVGDRPEAEQALRSFFGLDQPLYVRYLTWLAGAVHGDFGVSWRYGQPVLTLVGRAFFVTLEIGLLTLFLATLVGVPLGVLAAINEGRATDYIIQSFNVLALSAPVFWVAMMLLFAVSATFGWSPPIGVRPAVPVTDGEHRNDVAAGGQPVPAAGCRLQPVRSSGCRWRQAAGLCAHRNRQGPAGVARQHEACGPQCTPAGGHFHGADPHPNSRRRGRHRSPLGLPGIGRLLLTSIQARDYPVVQGALLIVLVAAVVINLAVDLLYGAIDPRLRRR